MIERSWSSDIDASGELAFAISSSSRSRQSSARSLSVDTACQLPASAASSAACSSWTRDARRYSLRLTSGDEAGEVEPAAGVAVNSAGGGGEFLECAGFEFREDDGAAFVFDEAAGAVGQHRATERADAEAEDADVFLFQFFGAFFPIVVGGLAVAENHEEAVGSVGVAEGLEGGVEEGAVVGAALREIIGTQGGEEFAENFVIGAEWALEKGGAGKDDEADALALEFFEEGLDEERGAFAARGFDVGRKH